MRNSEDAGFTRRPEIRAILDRHEEGGGDEPLDDGDIAACDGLTLDDAIRVMEFLPGWQMEMRQNESPSIREMIRLGYRYAGIEFFGYRVPPEREDERISFEGFRIPKSSLSYPDAERLAAELRPDVSQEEMDQGDAWYFWWD